MIDTEPFYFFECRSCDAKDYGTPLPKYRTLECPACGSENVRRWEAKPNLTREWSYCEAQGHDWKPDRQNPKLERCACCGAERKF